MFHTMKYISQNGRKRDNFAVRTNSGYHGYETFITLIKVKKKRCSSLLCNKIQDAEHAHE